MSDLCGGGTLTIHGERVTVEDASGRYHYALQGISKDGGVFVRERRWYDWGPIPTLFAALVFAVGACVAVWPRR